MSGSLGDNVETLPYEFGQDSTAFKGFTTHGETIIIEDEDKAASPVAMVEEEEFPDSQVSSGWLGKAYSLYNRLEREEREEKEAALQQAKEVEVEDTDCDADSEDGAAPVAENVHMSEPIVDCSQVDSNGQCEKGDASLDLDEITEIPLVTRKQQLGTAHRETADTEPGSVEAGDANEDFQVDQPPQSDLAEGAEPKPRARANAKSKSSAMAKAKARATAKAKSAARRSAKAEEKERKAKETKLRAKRTCEVRPSSSAAPPAESPEIKEGQGASAGVHAAPTEHVPDTKRRRTRKASMISTDKAKGNMADKDQEMGNAGEEQDVEKADNKQKGKSRVSDKSKAEGTFASRYVPDSEVKAAKYRAIRDVFLQKLASCLNGQSKFQDTAVGHRMLFGPFPKSKVWRVGGERRLIIIHGPAMGLKLGSVVQVQLREAEGTWWWRWFDISGRRRPSPAACSRISWARQSPQLGFEQVTHGWIMF